VILVLLYAQTRIFFVMSRDGLLPDVLSKVHPKWQTPHVVTAITGVIVAVAAAFLPVGKLADIANAGTLYAFALVAVAVMVLRRTRPDVKRPFRVAGLAIIAPAAIAGCLFLFVNLPLEAMIVLPVWTLIGVAIYFLYGRSRSHLGRGVVEVVDDILGDETIIPIKAPDA
jgi:APA family basic amino acid/polyamine antiporter